MESTYAYHLPEILGTFLSNHKGMLKIVAGATNILVRTLIAGLFPESPASPYCLCVGNIWLRKSPLFVLPV